MPHAIIEYSANIEEDVLEAALCDRVHETLVACGLFSTKDIKTRSYCAEEFLVGEKGQDGSFVHVTVSLYDGRTLEQKQALSQSLIESLQEAEMDGVDSISVDIRDITKACYRKIGE